MRWVTEGKLYSGTLISERTFHNYVVPLNGTKVGNPVRQAANALYRAKKVGNLVGQAANALY